MERFDFTNVLVLDKFFIFILILSIIFLLTMVKLLLRNSYKNLEYFILIFKKKREEGGRSVNFFKP